MSYDCILGPDARRSLILSAVNEVRRKRDDSVLGRPDEFFIAELSWIAHNGYLSRDAYLGGARTGRGSALAPTSREAIFDIQEAYIRLREVSGKRYDWEDVASAVTDELRNDHDQRFYRHVVIDEGQDFSPEMIRSLALEIPDDGSLTFFGDVAQQIYGRAVSWRAAGLTVPRVWEFTKNYRNSPQIAALALAIAQMPYYEDQPDMVAPDEFSDAGPPPTVVELGDWQAEAKFVREQALAAGRLGTVGIPCRTDADAERIGRTLPGAQHLHSDMVAWRPEGISYGNVHSAKGYEFQTVILVGITEDMWPHPRAIDQAGEEEATALDGRLLYVGVSRARQSLIITRTRALSELMPLNEGLWQDDSR